MEPCRPRIFFADYLARASLTLQSLAPNGSSRISLSRDARVRVEMTPGERFAQMIETLFGLARLGYTDAKGLPHPLQLVLFARELREMIILRSPPMAVQSVLFGALAPIALARLSSHIPSALPDGAGAASLGVGVASEELAV
jgi:hypothetical protein